MQGGLAGPWWELVVPGGLDRSGEANRFVRVEVLVSLQRVADLLGVETQEAKK